MAPLKNPKKIAIIGAGPVGCAFAIQLIASGHTVTIAGRGARLVQLISNGGILSKKSEKATSITKTPVAAIPVSSLDTDTGTGTAQPWDLIILTITSHQFDDALFTTLQKVPRTTQILFMFNTFASLDRYFGPLGKERCIMGFPAIAAAFHGDDGALVYKFMSFGQISIISSPEWRAVFSAAGITCGHEPDMQSWLRSHAAIAVAVMSAAVASSRKKAGLSWAEARRSAGAAREGLALVRKLENEVTPKVVKYLGVKAPGFVLTGLIWGLTRVPMLRNSPQVPNWEREMLGLVDSMIAAAPQDDDVRLLSELREKFV
jgi:2-dehydropantoate 2-reductase